MTPEAAATLRLRDLATVPVTTRAELEAAQSEMRRLAALYPASWAAVPVVVRMRRVVPAELRAECAP